MSFAVTARAATKAAALVDLRAKLGEVLRDQPAHSRDVPDVIIAAVQAVDNLADMTDHDVVISANGTLTGDWGPDNALLCCKSSAFSVAAHLVYAPRPVETVDPLVGDGEAVAADAADAPEADLVQATAHLPQSTLQDAQLLTHTGA